MWEVNKRESNGLPISPLLMLDQNPTSPLFSSEQQFLKYKQKLCGSLLEESQQNYIAPPEALDINQNTELRLGTWVVLRIQPQIFEAQKQEIAVEIESIQDQQKSLNPRLPKQRSKRSSLSLQSAQQEEITRMPSLVSFKSGILNHRSCKLQRRMSLGRPVVDPELEKKAMGIVKILYDCGFQVNKPLIECVEDYCIRRVKLKSASHFYKFKKRFEKYIRYQAHSKFSRVSMEVRAEVLKRLRDVSGIYHEQFGKILVKSRPSLKKWYAYFNLQP